MATSLLDPRVLGLASLARGTSREQIALADAQRLRTRGVLVEDARRERPRYFDGRFLVARDLIRDQQYFLTREADLGRAAGSGVSSGLQVNAGSGPSQLVIGAGAGVTPAGELVLLPDDLQINLADLPLAEQLSARFGLGRIPAAPMRSRTGLFVLALRPVEYTANPVGAYPTTLTGPRTVEDGDVIEATAVTLVPWQDDGAADALQARRARAARRIFVQGEGAAVSSNLLPLAMIALEGNTLAWIDEAMVRRELGADRADLPGLGFAPRGLRLAHLMQHTAHLDDVTRRMAGRSFPAATQFDALPPAGPLPPGVIDPGDFTQRYFPSQVDVDFSIIPEDELPSLVEEALALPPIDLLDAEAALDRTAVLVLAPVPRAEWRAVTARLQSRLRTLLPAAPNLIAQRKPLEILARLRLPLPVPAPSPSDTEWARLAGLPGLWYVRRRNLAYRDDLAGTPQAVVAGPAPSPERRVGGGAGGRVGTAPLAGGVSLRTTSAAPASATEATSEEVVAARAPARKRATAAPAASTTASPSVSARAARAQRRTGTAAPAPAAKTAAPRDPKKAAPKKSTKARPA